MVKDIRGSKHPVQETVCRQRKATLPQIKKRKPNIPSFKRLNRNPQPPSPPRQDRVYYIGHNKFSILYRVYNEDAIECKIVSEVHDWYSLPLPSKELNYCFAQH